MSTLEKVFAAIISIAVVILLILGWRCAPYLTTVFNRKDYEMRKADDVTNYKTIKKVEDTCRVMIASYEADKLTYEQYKDSDSKLEKSWSDQAKMRANQTASTYNNYILENSFVWKDNVPEDIESKLEYLE